MNKALLLQMQLRWKLILNNRKLTAVILILPLLISLGIGTVFRDYSAIDRIPVALIDNDNTDKSASLILGLGELDTLDTRVTETEEALRLLGDNRIEAIFTIQPGYEAMLLSGEIDDKIEITFLESNMVASALGDIVAREIIREFAIYSAGVKAGRLLDSEEAQATAMEKTQGFIETNEFELKMNMAVIPPGSSNQVEMQNESNSAQNVMRDRIVLGMTLASTAFFLIFIGSSTVEERKQASFKRLKCAGQPRITGAFLGFFTFSTCLLLMQFTALTATLHLFNWTDMPYLIFILAAFSSSVCGIMLLSSTWFHKSSVYQSMAAPAVFFVCLAGGAFWSLELIPQNMKLLSQLTPVYWTMESLMSLSFGSITDALPLGVLLLLGPVLSLIAEERV